MGSITSDIYTLPDEVLLDLAAYLQRDTCHYQDLMNLALVSRKMASIAQEVIYQKVKIDSDAEYENGLNILCFLETILDRPELARKTKTLDLLLHGQHYNDEFFREATSDTISRFAALFEKADQTWPSLRYIGVTHLVLRLEMRYATAYASLIIALLPNLTHLGFLLNRVYNFNDLPELDAKGFMYMFPSSTRLASFDSIQSLTISFQHIRLLNSGFPRLTSLVLYQLHLLDWDLFEDTLVNLDYVIGDLKQLTIHMETDFSGFVGDDPWKLAILYLSQRLRSVDIPQLVVDIEEWGDWPSLIDGLQVGWSGTESLEIVAPHSPPDSISITSLDGFPRLRRLAMPYSALLSTADSLFVIDPAGQKVHNPRILDALPPSLEYLEITGCISTIQFWLECLLKEHKRFPSLAKVMVETFKPVKLRFDIDDIDYLRSDFGKVNIELSLHDPHRVKG